MKSWISLALQLFIALSLAIMINWMYTPIGDMSAPMSPGINVGTQSLYGTNYYWSDSLAISTSSFDSTFVKTWKQVSFYSNGADMEFKAGTLADTTSWSSHKWVKAAAGQVFSFDVATKLKRLEVRTQSGTGTFYLLGYKSTSQF